MSEHSESGRHPDLPGANDTTTSGSDTAAKADSVSAPSPPPARISSSEDIRWTLISHFGASALLILTVGTFGWLAGLLTLFLKGNSPTVRPHAVESTNFQLTWGVFTIIGLALSLITSWTCVGLLFGVSALISGGFAFVFSIIAGRQAQAGKLYRYPVSFRILQ